MTQPGFRPTSAPPLYAQDGKGYDAIVHAHYFIGGSDWLATEYDPADDLAFGWACMNNDRQLAELGYFSLAELESIKVPLQVSIDGAPARPFGFAVVERDEGWPQGLTLTEAIRELDERSGRA